MLFSGYKKLFLTFSEVKGVSPIVYLFLTFWWVKSGKGGVQRSATPKAASKSRTNNRKSKTVQAETKNSNNNRKSTNNKPHKQQQVAQTAAQIAPNSSNTAAQTTE